MAILNHPNFFLIFQYRKFIDRSKRKSDGAISGWGNTSYSNLLIFPGSSSALRKDLVLSYCRITLFLSTIAGHFSIKDGFTIVSNNRQHSTVRQHFKMNDPANISPKDKNDFLVLAVLRGDSFGETHCLSRFRLIIEHPYFTSDDPHDQQTILNWPLNQ